jgi:hypothetical protein
MTERQSRITEVSEPEEDDVLELTEEAEEQPEAEEEQEEQPEKREELVVQIGDEEPEEVEETPAWVKELRRTNREQAKRIKELEAKDSQADKPKLGAKPTMESCDYDTAEYERQLDTWHEQKRAHDAAETAAEQAQRQAEERWQTKLSKLNEDKSALGADDIEEVEEVVRDTFSVTQQGIIVQGAGNAALVFYALGKNPSKAKEIAAITDPVEFAFAIARLEPTLKTGKRSVPAPEGTVKLKSRPGNVTDNTLDKLRAQAEKTGDYTPVIQYRKQMKERA